jgi:hypothetical protein
MRNHQSNYFYKFIMMSEMLAAMLYVCVRVHVFHVLIVHSSSSN